MFPKPYTVTHTPCVDVGQDGMGNDVPIFGDPVQRKVYGWGAHRREFRDGETSRDIAEVDLSLPASVPVSMFDHFKLDDGDPFQVVGLRDNTHGFHGWRPGVVAELKRVTG